MGTNGANHRENADDYRGDLFRFDKHRVAACCDGIQWLHQRQRPGSSGVGSAWDTLGHCATRATLMRLLRSKTGAEAAESASLPARIGV